MTRMGLGTTVYRRRHFGGLYRPTLKAFRVLHPHFNVVNDCSATCTCGECVMRRMRKAGKLRRGQKRARG